MSTIQTLAQQVNDAHHVKRVATPRFRPAVKFETPLSFYAKHVRKMRLDARSHLPADLFGDPGFDMLIDLFIAREEQTQLSITSIVTAGLTPATTGLRWLAKLEKHALVDRSPDPFDARRSYIGLSESGYSMMTEWLSRHATSSEEER
jgi:hypothetical protein